MLAGINLENETESSILAANSNVYQQCVIRGVLQVQPWDTRVRNQVIMLVICSWVDTRLDTRVNTRVHPEYVPYQRYTLVLMPEGR